MSKFHWAAAMALFLMTAARAEPPADVPTTPGLAAPPAETSVPPPLPPVKKQRFREQVNYKISVSDDKKIIHLMGIFASGIAGELKSILQKNPEAETIVLSSLGGSMIDGFAVEKIVSQHGLNTHVELFCASACTEAFWGGKERTLGGGARLGYHQATGGAQFPIPFALGDERQSPVNQLWRKRYRQRGFSESFIEKAISTPTRDMWLPTQDELIAEKIVTRVTNISQPGIAISGSWTDVGAMERSVLSGKWWDYLRVNQPKIYYVAAHTAWVNGQFLSDADEPADSAAKTAIKMILKNADELPDRLLLRFIAMEHSLWTARSDVLNNDCPFNGFGQFGFPVASHHNSLQSEQREALLLEMAAAHNGEVQVDKARRDKADASLLEYWTEMMVQGEYDSRGVDQKFCSEPVNYYDILLKLPEEKRSEYFRALVTTILHPTPVPMPGSILDRP